MRTSRNPFSIYDLLGYLIPGLLAIYGLNFFLPDHKNVKYILELCNGILKNNQFEFENIVSLFVAAYLLGHILSYLSAMLIEKFSIWSIDYPTKYLLAAGYLQNEHDVHHQNVRKNLYFLIKYFSPRNKPNILIYFLRALVFLFLIPLAIPLALFALMFNVHISIRKTLDKKLADTIYKKIEVFLGTLDIQLKKEDIGNFEWFRIIEHYIIENHPQHAPKMDNYVALYGFNRNITLLMVLFFWFCVYLWIKHGITIYGVIVMSILSVFSFIFYAAFNKFFRRYSLEVMMALVANKEPSPKTTD